MKIPLLDLKAQHAPLRRQILEAIERVLDTQQFILGPEVARLEKRIAAYCGTRFAIGVSSGTDALLIALMALGIGPGDEVITSTYSFVAAAGVIARLGARPVLVDIDPATYNVDPTRLATAVTRRTRAIIPVHLFGQCAEMGPVEEFAAEHNLDIIEDAAQAIGAEYRGGRRAGSIGQFGCLSFYPSKNLGTLGDGGMVLTNDTAHAEKLRALRVHGGEFKYDHHLIGGNFRLDEIQAAVLNVKLDYLDDWTAARQRNALHYEDLFRASGLVCDEGITLPLALYQSEGLSHYHIYNQFVIRVSKRDQLFSYLKTRDIGAEIYYPVPIHRQKCFEFLNYKDGDFPESERAARHCLALPVYPGISEADQEHIVNVISASLRGA
jgi:dTDP-4-amino-4,6-dideoxygalactose transaminase